MNEMILVYVICKDEKEARDIAKHLLQKNLCACVNIINNMKSLYKWPAKSDNIEESNETILLIKTLEEKSSQVSMEVSRKHSYEVPCIFSIKPNSVDPMYLSWMVGEIY